MSPLKLQAAADAEKWMDVELCHEHALKKEKEKNVFLVMFREKRPAWDSYFSFKWC